ncbi:MAG: hypothetical protein ACLUMK_11465 [Christensenellales bacterium]
MTVLYFAERSFPYEHTGKRYHPVKPARSYKEQLARLTDIHGLTIEDEARARYILSPSIITA